MLKAVFSCIFVKYAQRVYSSLRSPKFSKLLVASDRGNFTISKGFL